MTFILSCLTDKAVYQVSDRRLTLQDPPYACVDDATNKIVVVDGEMTVGYTGLSKIGGEKTSDWLARVLAKSSQTDSLNVLIGNLQSEATAAFARLTFGAQYKRHAFLCVGWFGSNVSPDLVPGVFVVDNAIDPVTHEWQPQARDSFSANALIPAPIRYWHGYESYIAGYLPTPEESWTIDHHLKKCIRHKQATHRTIITGMAMVVRYLAQSHNSIGSNLMAVCIPRSAIERANQTNERVVWNGPPAEDESTFMHLSASGYFEFASPQFVLGGAVMQIIESTGISHNVGVGFSRSPNP